MLLSVKQETKTALRSLFQVPRKHLFSFGFTIYATFGFTDAPETSPESRGGGGGGGRRSGGVTQEESGSEEEHRDKDSKVSTLSVSSVEN